MKENKFVRFITSKYLVLTVQLIATAVFTYFIFVLNIIPLKHLIPDNSNFSIINNNLFYYNV